MNESSRNAPNLRTIGWPADPAGGKFLGAAIVVLVAFTLVFRVDSSLAEDESPALQYARRDVRHATALAGTREQEAREAAETPTLKAVRAAEAAKAAVDALSAEAVAKLATAEAERIAGKAALDAASAARMAATRAVDEALANAAQATAALEDVEATRERVRAAVALADADLVRANDAKNEAEAASRQILLEAARERARSADRTVDEGRAKLELVTARVESLRGEFTTAEQREEAATTAVDAAAQVVVIATAERDRVQALAERAAALLKDLVEHAKPAEEARAKAEADAATARDRVARFTNRLSRLDGVALDFDPRTLHEMASFPMTRPAISCRFSSDGATLLAGGQQADLARWDVVDGTPSTFVGHRSWTRRFDADEESVVSGDYSGQLSWWNPRESSPRPVRTVDAHDGYVRAVAVSPDRRFVATGGNDGMVRIWDAATGAMLTELEAHRVDQRVLDLVGKPDEVFVNHVYNVRFDPTGRFLVTGDLLGVLKLWEVGTWKHLRDFDAGVLHGYDTTFRAHCGGIRGLDISPDGKLVAAAGIANVTNAFAGVGNPCVALFELETGNRVAVLEPANKFQGTCWSVRFHPSGQWLVGAGGGAAGSLWFWEPTEEKSFFDLATPNVAYDVDIHPDGLRLGIALYDGTVRIWDLAPPPPVAAEKSE